MRWVLFAALAWLAVIAGFAVAMRWPAPPPRLDPSERPTSALARVLTELAREGETGRHPWVIVKAWSAQQLLVADVEARRLDEAPDIARQIVDPVRDKYDEVLIYVRAPGAAGTSPTRRVRWTKTGGYSWSAF